MRLAALSMLAWTLLLLCPIQNLRAGGSAPGVNLSSVNDYASQLLFTDLFKQSRPWLSAEPSPDSAWDSGYPVPVDPSGYPLRVPFMPQDGGPQIVHTLMARDIGGHYPAGTYTFSYAGNGSVELRLDAGPAVFHTAGEYPVAVHPSSAGISLRILRSEPSDPVHDICLVMPGYAANASSPFFPVCLERLRPFPVLRFMDACAVNSGMIRHWTDRTTPDSATQAGNGGLAYEYVFDLCTKTQTSPWLCFPHLATDDYARNLARLACTRLSEGSIVYLEYSNELWNTIFPQARYVREQGHRLHLDPDPYVSGILYGVKRALELFDVFIRECGGRLRVITILSGQTVNPHVGELLLRGLDSPAINPHDLHVDALAIAPYLGHDIMDRIARSGQASYLWPEEVITQLEAELPELGRHIAAYHRLASSRGLRLFAYEGGQHLAAQTPEYRDNPDVTDLIARANASEGMRTLYASLLETWQHNGGDIFVLFAFSAMPGKYGAWGLLEWTEQPLEEAPKYRAALDAASR